MIDAETKRLAEQMDGWLTEREMTFLYQTARQCTGRGAILEIGSFQGKSTSVLARASRAGAGTKVHAMDPHISDLEHRMKLGGKSSFDLFQENVRRAGVEDMVVPIVGRSQDLAKDWDRPIEFLWIDGDHSFEGALADFELYAPHVVEGGVIAFHDSTQDDLPAVIDRAFGRKGMVELGLTDSITYARKRTGRSKTPRDHAVLFLVRHYDDFRKVRFLKRQKHALKGLIARM